MRKKSKVKRVLWGTPKLIIVVRGKREDGALGTCKAMVGLGGPSTSDTGCDKATGCACLPKCAEQINS